jgi:hypothetical protein
VLCGHAKFLKSPKAQKVAPTPESPFLPKDMFQGFSSNIIRASVNEGSY